MVAETKLVDKNSNISTSTLFFTVFFFSLHSNAEPSEKRFRMNSFVADFGRPLESERDFSHQMAEESQ